MAIVVLATRNTKKLRELARIFAESGLAMDFVSLDEFPEYPEPVETERSFEGNALLKARAAVAETGRVVVADDSGLEVEVLNDLPGVRSARWAGPGASDAENLELLLRQLADVPPEERRARFVCAMALVLPDGTERVVRGEMIGRLITEPRGENGFGYDPAFVTDGFELTNGELAPEVKDSVSHRGRAVRALVELLLAEPELIREMERG